MNNSMTGVMAGNSSPSKLAPETIRIRNALIEKYADQPIEELNNFLQHALEAEKDELKRLGLLAARVYILRQKVLSLKAFIRDERMDNIPTPNLALTEQILLDETAHSDIDANDETVASGEWHSLQMIEPGEVNGVRFFQGTVINAKAEDAEKLISSGKAIVIDDEGNPIEKNADDSGDKGDSEDTLDPESNATDGDPESNATDGGIPLDDKNADDPNALDTTVSVENTNNDNTVDPNADVIDETAVNEATDNGNALDDKNVEDPNVEDGIEDTSEESTKNRDADG